MATHPALDGTIANIFQIDFAAHPPGACGAPDHAGGGLVNDRQTAVGGRRATESRPLGSGNFRLQERGVAVTNANIRADQPLVRINGAVAGLLAHAGQANAQLVAKPRLGAAANGIAIHIGGGGRVFVLNDQIDRVGADRAAAHHGIGAGGGRQWLVQDDNALHVVNSVVDAGVQLAA